MKPKLIKTLAQVTAQVPVNMTSNFDMVAPFLGNAEQMYVLRLIGQAQFDALVAAIDADPADKMLEAITRCQKVIANLGYYFAIPLLSVSIGTSGIQIISNQDTKNAFQWQVNDLKNSLQELGFTGIEEMLTYLEENAETFTQYAASDQLKAQKECLITTAADFNNYFDISGSRFVFQSINYIMRRVEQQSIMRVLGGDFFASLKAEVSVKQKTLVNTYLKPGIALLTIAKAIIERVVTLKDGQVTFNFKGRTENMNESQALNNQQIGDMSAQLSDDGNLYIKDGLQYIIDNPADFEDFTPPVARRRFRITNDPTKGVFGI